MVKVFCKCDQNRTKATYIIQQKPQNVDGRGQKNRDGHAGFTVRFLGDIYSNDETKTREYKLFSSCI